MLTSGQTSQSAVEETAASESASPESSDGQSSSATASPTGEDAAQQSDDPNRGSALTWDSGSAAAAVAAVAFFMTLIL